MQHLDPDPTRFQPYNYWQGNHVIRRTALAYSPTSTAHVNYERLPPRAATATMQLAYREHTVPEAGALVWGLLQARFWTAAAITAAVFAIPVYMPLSAVPAFALGATLFWALLLILSHSLTLRRALQALLAPILVLGACQLLAPALNNRVFASTLLAAGTLVYFAACGGLPLRFYYRWLYAHPRLRPETRERQPDAPRPSLLSLAAFLTIAIVVGSVSSALAVLMTVVLAVLLLGGVSGARDAWGIAREIFSRSASHGRGLSLAPGTWAPDWSSRPDVKTLFRLVLLLTATLMAATSLFTPDMEVLVWPYADADLRADGALLSWEALSRSPVWWTHAVADAAMHRELHSAWLIAASIVATVSVPPLVFTAVYAPALRRAERERLRVEGGRGPTGEWVAGLDEDGRCEWEWYFDRIVSSPHTAIDPLGQTVREAEHFFVGVEPRAGFPVLLDRGLLSEHAYFVGDSGSGKTSLGIMPLLIQLIRGHADGKGATTPCPPIVIIDLKGDPALFHTAREEAERRGADFRFFTPERGMASHYFNPFDSMASENRTDIQLATLMLDALSLNHGDSYGRSFYSRQSRQLLLDAVKHPSSPRSFEELYEVLQQLRRDDPTAYRDTFELVSTIHALQSYPMLAVGRTLKRPEQAIHMPSVLERQQVVYFWLPSAVESVSVREIGKLALYSLLTAAIDRQRAMPRDQWRQAYIFIDEFQRIASDNFRVILEQARSFGLAAILANQSIADLDTPDVDLRPAVRTNTRYKRAFSVTTPQEVRDISDNSGFELMMMRSWSQPGEAGSTRLVAHSYDRRSDSQALKPRLVSNDILEASDHPLDSIFTVSRGSGYTQYAGLPIVVRSTWPMTADTYRRRQGAPWPAVEAYDEDEVAVSDVSPVSIDYQRDRETSERVHQAMQDLLAEEA